MRQRLAATCAALVLGGTPVLAACSGPGGPDQQAPTAPAATQATPTGGGHHGQDHSTMDHPMDGGPAPQGIEKAADAKYPVGTTVKLTADHMEGMDGAKATIAGAYDTYTYAVNFTPTTGGAPVTDHKWVVQEELQDAGRDRLADGTPVTLLAEHMTGMKDARATVASSTDQTVYMVDYDADGMTMTNHKWVVESEIEPAS